MRHKHRYSQEVRNYSRLGVWLCAVLKQRRRNVHQVLLGSDVQWSVTILNTTFVGY